MTGDEHRGAGLEIRSFHVVFRLERRLHRIDRWRLPFPHGVPVAAIGHGAVVLVAVIVLGQLPVFGALISGLPAPVAYVLIPGACASALTRLRIDGRPAHRHLLALLTGAIRGRRTAAARTAPMGALHITDATLLTHGPDRAGYPHAVVTGPATVRLRRPARAHARARTLRLTPQRGRLLHQVRIIRVADGQRLLIRRPR